MTKRWWLCIALLVCGLIAACDDGADPAPPPRETPSPSPEPSLSSPTPSVVTRGACANATQAASGDPLGGRTSGDVDGDGSDDAVYLVSETAGGPGCRTFVIVETGAAILVAPTSEEGVEHALQAPRINSLVQVDGRGGAEILVDLEQGASTQFVGMFTVTGGTLERVRVAGPAPSGDLFPYGGSVGHIEASDCGPEPASVVVTTASPVGRRYEVRTTTYEMVGSVLRPVAQQRRPRVVDPSELGDVEAFRSPPFGSCGT